MRMFRSNVVAVLVVGLAIIPQIGAGQSTNRWATAKCDIKPAHFLVNSGLLYLKSATESKFDDQKQKDLRDAYRVLNQALTTGGQEKNPAAWYYLGRYYIMTKDLAGADSAFRRTEALRADCAEDINSWRRQVWVPALNEGIAAWQANNADSAMKALRQANAIFDAEPQGFKYMASLLYNAGQLDSAAFYFRRAADIAAKDSTKFLQDRKDALFNLARIRHSERRWPDAEAAYREYLTVAQNDADGMAGLGSVLMAAGQRDSAFALYRRIIARGDSGGSLPLFRAGVEIFQSVAEEPDTQAAGRRCRGTRAAPARVRTCRDSLVAVMKDHEAASKATYRLAAQAFEAGVKANPNYRDGLYNLVNTYLQLNDSAAMLPIAQRLVKVDPLNRMSIRLLAFAHQRMGRVDSTLHYLRVADSTLVTDVTISEFDPQEQSAAVKGVITNMRTAPSPPVKLVFEFLSTKGDVVATQTAEVPAIPAEGTHPFELKAIGAGIQAWRYRRE